MNVHLTFDVEVWCKGWTALDANFPAQYERYVYGRSRHGDYALPKTLEILERSGLRGVFFVEPLFSARFGASYLERIVEMILAAGQDVQLHVHPEWIDEIDPPVIPNHSVKRQHLTYYDLEEQTAIIRFARQRLMDAGAPEPTAFRAGSYAANRDTFEALRRNGIAIDSSLNACSGISGIDLSDAASRTVPSWVGQTWSVPVSVFRDGTRRLRPMQVGACSFEEMRDGLTAARAAGASDAAIVSHNFELLRPGSSEPDFVVLRRFERLCAWLSERRAEMPVIAYSLPQSGTVEATGSLPVPHWPEVGLLPTARRYLEQLRRRVG